MSVRIDESTRYYDLPIEEEELSQSQIHYFVIRTLISIIEQMYENQNVGLRSSVNIYYPNQPAVAPDVAVIDDLTADKIVNNSYYVNDQNPAPRVAIEIASGETWERDLKDKLARYERMQTQEYFVFDPNVPQVWSSEWRTQGRIVGWHLEGGSLRRLPQSEPTRIWSAQLNSWLVAEPYGQLYWLRLYTQDSVLLPTIDEARDAERRRANSERRRAEIEKLRAETEKQRAEVEKLRAETEKQRADDEKQRADAAEAELERLRKLLEKPKD